MTRSHPAKRRKESSQAAFEIKAIKRVNMERIAYPLDERIAELRSLRLEMKLMDGTSV